MLCVFYINYKYVNKDDYIVLLQQHADEMRNNYGLRSMTLFGSVARGENNENSDVDLCVDMEPKITAIVKLKEFLEKLLNRSVDIVRMHKHINPFLLKEIEKDGTLIF